MTDRFAPGNDPSCGRSADPTIGGSADPTCSGRADPPYGPSGDAGFVAGLEALSLGVAVFVIGTLILVNGWAVIDAKFATNAAAREAVRAVVETPGRGPLTDRQLEAIALSAARQAGAAHGYVNEALNITPATASGALTQARCGSVRIQATVVVRPTVLPGIVGPGSLAVSSIHEEVVDPFRSGLAARDDLDRVTGNVCGF